MDKNNSVQNVSGTVLVVDDDDLVRDSLMTALKALPIKLISAENGEEALKIVKKQNVDLVISDIKMPKMDGIQFITALREQHYSTLVIFVTGYGDKDLVRKAWNLGAYDFIDKPFDIHYLRNVTKAALLYGKTFSEQKFKESKDKIEAKFYVNEKLFNEFIKLCASKNLNSDSIVNSLIAKYIGSNTK